MGLIHLKNSFINEMTFNFEPVSNDSRLTQERLLSLSTNEIQEFKTFKIEKRKQDWIAGRIAAKKAIQLLLQQKGLPIPDSSTIQISKSRTGRPVISLAESKNNSPLIESNSWFVLKELVKELDISISHSGKSACAAAVQCFSPDEHSPSTRRIGIDLEKIEPLDPVLFPIALTASEKNQIEKNNNEINISSFYAIWTAKEALLKALDLGLSVDLLQLEVNLINLTGKAQVNNPNAAKVTFLNKEYRVNFHYLKDYILSSCLIL